MIDLEKLKERFDNLFENETSESFYIWLARKKSNQIKLDFIDIIGVGEIEELKSVKNSYFTYQAYTNFIVKLQKPENITRDTSKYAIAA